MMLRLISYLMLIMSLVLTVTAVSLRFDVGSSDDYPEIYDWFHSHEMIEFASYDEIDARKLFKHGLARVKNTNTVIIPDGDEIDLISFDGLKPHSGDYYQFAEYDMLKMKKYQQVNEKSLGTGLDNTKSTVTNKVSYSVTASSDKTLLLYGDYTFKLGPIDSSDHLEIDTTLSRSKSKEISCDVLPGKISYVKVNATVVIFGNIKKRIIGVEVSKKSFLLLKHTYSLEFKNWDHTEFELVKDQTLYCLNVDSKDQL